MQLTWWKRRVQIPETHGQEQMHTVSCVEKKTENLDYDFITTGSTKDHSMFSPTNKETEKYML